MNEKSFDDEIANDLMDWKERERIEEQERAKTKRIEKVLSTVITVAIFISWLVTIIVVGVVFKGL